MFRITRLGMADQENDFDVEREGWMAGHVERGETGSFIDFLTFWEILLDNRPRCQDAFLLGFAPPHEAVPRTPRVRLKSIGAIDSTLYT